MSNFARLFSPFSGRRLTTRSRLAILPHGTGMVRDGNLTEADIAYYEARARRGVGLVITGGAIASPTSALRVRNLFEAWDERHRDMLAARARAVRDAGAQIVCQILHLGREFTGADSDNPPAAPSPVRSPRDPFPPHELSDQEIRAIIGDFVRSAQNIVAAGCDGIELHAAHGYLLAQFLSPAVNRRTDRWGGAPEKRMRLLLETIDAIRAAVGADVALGVRMSADEEIEGGLRPRDVATIAQALAASGAVDYLNITIGVRGAYVKDASWPEAPAAGAAALIRRESGLPILLGQKILSPDVAERLLEEGAADLIGAARAFVADAGFAEKSAAGEERRIRPCVGLNQDCRAFAPHVHCAVTPETGRETNAAFGPLTRAALSKRVAVVGGGPAGMEAARVAAARGHAVTLFEAAKNLGGQFLLAAASPHRGQLRRIIDHLAEEMRRENVRIELDARVESAKDLAMFDAVVVAVGASAAPPPGGIGSRRARSWFDILVNGAPAPFGDGRALFADDGSGFWPSYSVVEILAEAGWRAAIATPSAMIAANIPHESVPPLLARLGKAKTTFHALTTVARSDDGGVVLTNVASGESRDAPCDLLVLQTGRRANPNPLTGAEETVARMIGDCVAPRRVSHAIFEGNSAGRSL